MNPVLSHSQPLQARGIPTYLPRTYGLFQSDTALKIPWTGTIPVLLCLPFRLLEADVIGGKVRYDDYG